MENGYLKMATSTIPKIALVVFGGMDKNIHLRQRKMCIFAGLDDTSTSALLVP
jgi:hypothetical protein